MCSVTFPGKFGVNYDVIGRGSAQDLFDEQLEVRDLLRSQRRRALGEGESEIVIIPSIRNEMQLLELVLAW